MVPEEPWDLSCSSLYCKMGALLLFLLPDILSPILGLTCQDIDTLQEAFLDSTPTPKGGGQSPSAGPRKPPLWHSVLSAGFVYPSDGQKN